MNREEDFNVDVVVGTEHVKQDGCNMGYTQYTKMVDRGIVALVVLLR